jgi:hypothetical protein
MYSWFISGRLLHWNSMVIYSKDIINITGCKDRTARKMLQLIREKYRKEKNGLISISEFCEYTGLRETDVKNYMRY